MKFGYILPNYGGKITPQDLLRIAEACEDLGFDSVWATDHVIVPAELREPYGELLEPLTTLSVIAGRTRRLRLGTSILVLPQRNPVLVAKQVASLDAYSGGRVTLGVGAGWAEKEFGYLGADFAGRGKVLDESIDLMRALWKGEGVEFGGEKFTVGGAVFLPRPVQETVPIWIGGNSKRAVDRARKLGDGWHPVGPTFEELERGKLSIRKSGRRVTASVRMTTDLRKKRDLVVLPNGEKRMIVSGSPTEVRGEISRLEAAGLEYYCASVMHPSVDDILADLTKFGSEVVRSYR